MQNTPTYIRLYLIATIWILFGLYQIFKAIRWDYSMVTTPRETVLIAEMVVFGSFSISIGLGLLFRSKFISLELLSLPLALLAFSSIWTILLGWSMYYFLLLEYLTLLLILPTRFVVQELQLSPPLSEWKVSSIILWVMLEVLLFNAVVYLLV